MQNVKYVEQFTLKQPRGAPGPILQTFTSSQLLGEPELELRRGIKNKVRTTAEPISAKHQIRLERER